MTLQNYYRQTKLILKLPTLGKWYTDVIKDNKTSIEIKGMNAIDELKMSSPETMLEQETYNQIIKSCCPDIIKPELLTYVDREAILLAIKSATYGDKLHYQLCCPYCGDKANDDDYLDYYISTKSLLESIDYYTEDYKIDIDDQLTINLKPCLASYSDKITDLQFKISRLEKVLSDIEKNKNDLSNDEIKEKIKHEIDSYITSVCDSITKLIIASIESIEEKDTNTLHTSQETINMFVNNADAKIITKIRDYISETNIKKGVPNTVKLECLKCHKQFEYDKVTLGYIDFLE